jgi:short-subunit dehydrogenase
MAAALASQALALLAQHALAATACAGLTLLLLQLARHALSDADFGALAALRAYPRRGAFSGQVVLIVGASSGIGEALALEFARGGATVLLAARRMELLLALADRCLAEGAPASEAVRLDVTALDAHEATLDYLLRKYSRIDVLCNNAGRSQRGLVEATPAAVDLELFHLNFFSVVAFTKALLRRALAPPGFALRVLNTSSVAGKLGSPLSASYAASKHALQGWMDTLRMEMGWRGVRGG